MNGFDNIKIEKEGNKITVRLTGDIDHHTAAVIKNKVDRLLLTDRPDTCILDLSRVDFMDSSGLGLILGRIRLASETGVELVLRSPGENVMKILRVAGYQRLVETERKNAQ